MLIYVYMLRRLVYTFSATSATYSNVYPSPCNTKRDTVCVYESLGYWNPSLKYNFSKRSKLLNNEIEWADNFFSNKYIR